MKKIMLIASAALLLAACGEQAQTIGGVKQDAAPYTGTGKPYALTNWKAGDKASWESQLKVRAEGSQNDYNRIN